MKIFAKIVAAIYFANFCTYFGLYHQNRMTYNFEQYFRDLHKNRNRKQIFLHKNKISHFLVLPGISKFSEKMDNSRYFSIPGNREFPFKKNLNPGNGYSHFCYLFHFPGILGKPGNYLKAKRRKITLISVFF